MLIPVYYSFLVLPAEQRHAIIAVWDFCRAVDDAADEAKAGEEEGQVGQWRNELARCYDGREAETPQGRALKPLVRRFHLPRSAFDALIEGVEMDLHPRRYATFRDLYEYCIRVASAVGLLCVEIFGCREPGSRQYAIDLGVALQLTNILQTASDLPVGRLHSRRRSGGSGAVPIRDGTGRAGGARLMPCGGRRAAARAGDITRGPRRVAG